MRFSRIVIFVTAGLCLINSPEAIAACPSADLTGDCFVDFDDFAVMANQWLTTDPCVPNDMVYIPDGEFEMGDHFAEGSPIELPVHTVTLDSFYMCKYEVTNGQYCQYLNSALGSSWSHNMLYFMSAFKSHLFDMQQNGHLNRSV